MAGSRRNDLGFDIDARGENRERLEKAVRIGAAVILTTIALIAIRMVVGTGDTQAFSIEKAQTSQDAAQPTEKSSRAIEATSMALPAAEPVSVYVSGAVASPGVYEIAADSRVVDAVDAAGGFSDGAQSESVNLARKVTDGEQIHIPREDDAQVAPEIAQGDAGSFSGLININTAGESELESLPGIGPATASKIISERETNGPFESVDDLARVSGIGAKKIEGLRDSACV